MSFSRTYFLFYLYMCLLSKSEELEGLARTGPYSVVVGSILVVSKLLMGESEAFPNKGLTGAFVF